ncbi:odorant receptor 4-like [Zophobas morio]|uniref:odorant receptor 4-like n=1 Tax=Zophobas morio TaxID=2755281 RepID=UPI0030831006
MASSAWLLIPILTKGTQDKQLPFAAWYPYDSTISPLYEFTYIYQCVATLYLVTTMCDNLCDDLKNLHHDLYNVDVNQRVIACVKHHQAILSSAVDSNKFFDKTILGQLVTTTVTFAVNMLQLSLVVNLGREGVKSVFNVMAVITQIFIYCWFGEEVQVKSSQIPYSAFESDWTGIPIEAKKNLLIFIMRAQKPIKMSAINLFSLSLATFTTILRTSWSYFAVLRQVNAQE